MSNNEAESSALASMSSNEPTSKVDEVTNDANIQRNAAVEEALEVEETSKEHYHFLVKHTKRTMEVRLAVDDTVTELKAVSNVTGITKRPNLPTHVLSWLAHLPSSSFSLHPIQPNRSFIQ